jgi:hypothetical protein
MLFYTGSFAYDQAEAVAKELIARQAFVAAGGFKSLQIIRKHAG